MSQSNSFTLRNIFTDNVIKSGKKMLQFSARVFRVLHKRHNPFLSNKQNRKHTFKWSSVSSNFILLNIE